MIQRRKGLLVTMAVLIGIFGFELVREEITYKMVTRKLENAHQQIQPRMKEEEVKQLAGMPDSTRKTEDGNTSYWDASLHQGKLWRMFSLASAKGHQTLVVEFDDRSEVSRVWGGIN
jgi:hypothetical protein